VISGRVLPAVVLAAASSVALLSGAGRQAPVVSGHPPPATAETSLATGQADEVRRLADAARAALALAERARGTDDEHLRHLEAAAVAARAAGASRLLGIALHRQGDHLFNRARYEEAMDVLTRAAAAFREANAPDDLGTVHNSIGRVYRAHGSLDAALAEQLQALAIHERGTQRWMHIQSLNAVAVVQQHLGNLPEARHYYGRALELARTLGDVSIIAFLQANLGQVLADEGDYEAAAAAFEEALARSVDDHASVRHTQLAETYLQLNRVTEAQAAADRAVALCGAVVESCLRAHSARSWALATSGELPAAMRDNEYVLRQLEQMRAKLLPVDFLKQGFTARHRDYVSRSIGLLQRGEHSERDALAVAETGRARAFLDLLASRNLSPAPPPTAAAPDDAAHPAGHPPVIPSRSLAAPATADDVVAIAARLRSTMVSYWVAADQLTVWVVSPEGRIAMRTVNVRASRLRQLVRATLTDPARTGEGAATPATRPRMVTRGARSVGWGDRSEAWRALYDVLVAPVRDLLPPTPGALVTIVPHGPLTGLSFAALKSPAGRYLLEDVALHYAPAAGVLSLTAASGRADARTAPAIVVSDPAPHPRSALTPALPRLPGARREAAAIARTLTPPRVLSLQDGEATESRVRESVAGRAVIHFATHAVMRDDEPFASYVALGASGAGQDDDGRLTAAEIYGMRLTADLVVLSACQSAGGMVTGDGVATFARAFLYAGSASLVASTWDVADEPTGRLMADFYRRWQAGADKAAALRRAQLGLLADLRAGRLTVETVVGPVPLPEHPVFWAGFALFGEPR
jgi:CHAT domain-containing protein/tetratricopeptide (TPR) repeat protein